MDSTPDRVRVEVLGPLRVWSADGREITPSGALQRRLLALLVLRRGRVVSLDTAIDALWPSTVPRDPVAALQNQVSRLRRALPDGMVVSIGSGYRVEPSMAIVDADELGTLVSVQPMTADAHARIEAILERWRGPAFAELDDVDDGRVETARLEELRIRSREQLAAHRIHVGEPTAAVSDLIALVAEEPLRERPHALLMAALHASGRTVDALRVFDDFRRRLGDELGIDPSPSLTAQHTALLVGVENEPRRVRVNDLPIPLTSLVGRESLVDRATSLIDDHRLVTLVGPGGVGKTRLALEVGHRLRSGAPDRPVVLCELSHVESDGAVQLVATALGIDARPGVPTQRRITDVVGHSELVLLLDNCEHVLDPVAELVEDALARCGGLKVLATSRERLRVGGETVCSIPTLVAGADDAAAIDLFVDRARAVRADFEPDATQQSRIKEIVHRLDGLPLAIELAAARLHTHELSEIATGLDRRFDLLSEGVRTATRHGSLAAAVSWSFDLLTAELRETLVHVSVFAGPFSAADAGAVCDEPATRAHELLSRLAERSLVMRAPAARFVLLETVREFAVDRLARSGRREQVMERHARWMVARTEDARRRMHVPGEPVLDELDAATGELHDAMAWLLDHGMVDEAGRLVAALVNYAVVRARPDVLGWSAEVVAADPDHRSPSASQVLAAQAYATWMTGDVVGSGALARDAVAVAERAGIPLPAVSATIRGNAELFGGRLDDAAEWYRRAIAAASDDPGQRLVSAGALLLALGYAADLAAPALAHELLTEVGTSPSAVAAYVWYCAGEADVAVDPARARERLRMAVQLAEATNASFARGVAGATVASLEARDGDPAAAAADYRWLLTHWRRAGMWSLQWTMLRSIAALLARLGRHAAAAVLYGAVRATDEGHRIFGADERALDELAEQLEAALGDDAFREACEHGARLDGEAAVEHALASL